jgi:membrane protease YdiL (CAAX protease family)
MKEYFKLDFTKKDIHVYIILISAPVLLTIYRYHGYPGTTNLNIDFGVPSDQAHTIFQFLFFFILTFILPALYIILAMKKSLFSFGFGAGDIKTGTKLLLLIPVLIVPAIFIASKMPDIRIEYPLADTLMTDQEHILIYEAAYVLFYYFAWEFFFRGFILFGLKDRLGTINAILIQTISSCLIHIGKPEGEILGSIIIGIIFGVIAIKTRSFWYVFLMHASIGVLLDLFIIYSK